MHDGPEIVAVTTQRRRMVLSENPQSVRIGRSSLAEPVQGWKKGVRRAFRSFSVAKLADAH